jgi:hypothetical protein
MILFTDKEFDQDLKSVDLEGIIWKRPPHDIVNEPVFIANDISIDEICQGYLIAYCNNKCFNYFNNFGKFYIYFKFITKILQECLQW